MKPALGIALTAGLAMIAHAQPDLSCNGFADVVYVGEQVQDFLVPSVSGATVFFTVQGADGVRAIFDALFDDNDQDFPGGGGGSGRARGPHWRGLG